MPSKTKKQVRDAKRTAARGAVDLKEGRLNPRAIRSGISQGAYLMNGGLPPDPPAEWRPWKKERFALSIRAAYLFLKGNDAAEIGPKIGKGKVGRDITKQRISQMVKEGIQFFMDRRFVRPVERKAAREAHTC